MSVWNECRTALRQLRKAPGFTVVVVVTLGLCIGANTAVYSVLDAVLLREVPYPQPDRLALVVTRGPLGDLETAQTGGQFEIVRDRTSTLDVAAYGGMSGVNFSAQGQAAHVRQQRVSAGFFRIFGVAPSLGREFERNEDVPNG